MDLSWFKWSKSEDKDSENEGTETCGTCRGKGKVKCVVTYESTWNGSAQVPIEQTCITCNGKKVVPKTQS
jgi:DnaJ-class molecular chaperone